MRSSRRIDRVFLIITALLVSVGFFIFASASMGLLTRNNAEYSSVIINQLVFGLILGGLCLYAASRIPYPFWKKYAPHILLGSLILNLLVFVPHLGLSSGGAHRWINIFGYSFQPSETLKIAFVIFFASWLAAVKSKVTVARYGIVPLLVLYGACGLVLLLQKDTDTLGVVIFSGLAMFICAGGKAKHIGIALLVGILAIAAVVTLRPYVLGRVLTFLDPSRDPLGAGYQIQQSLIAVGSGRLFGRGFGQSIQKFNYLPEPIGDSIFAVAAEEFGFVGSIFILVLFVLFSLRGLKIASRSPDIFATSLVVGIVTIIISQSFLNIGAMLAVIPLSGTPLLFISHGGSALLFALAECGIVLNISRYAQIKSA